MKTENKLIMAKLKNLLAIIKEECEDTPKCNESCAYYEDCPEQYVNSNPTQWEDLEVDDITIIEAIAELEGRLKYNSYADKESTYFKALKVAVDCMKKEIGE